MPFQHHLFILPLWTADLGLQNLEFENHKVLLEYLISVCTLRFQLQDTVLLYGTVLSLYPLHFRKYVSRLLIGSMLNFEAFLGAPLIEIT